MRKRSAKRSGGRVVPRVATRAELRAVLRALADVKRVADANAEALRELRLESTANFRRIAEQQIEIDRLKTFLSPSAA